MSIASAVMMNGMDLSKGCAAYIEAGKPKIAALQPVMQSLADSGKGTPAEEATTNANALAKDFFAEYEKFKDADIKTIPEEDKTRIKAEQARIPDVKAGMDKLNAQKDTLPAPVTTQLTALTTAGEDLKTYGRGALRPCFTDINTLRTAAQASGLMPATTPQRNAIKSTFGLEVFDIYW